MKRFILSILTITVAVIFSYIAHVSAVQVDLGPADVIRDDSIVVNVDGTDIVSVGQGFGLRILALMKIVIS